MSRFLGKGKRKKESGITLIALITTIIVLLILAGITIGAITGSNGIIGQAQSAKEETEISQEKEIIDISTVEAMGKNNRGNLEEEEFQNAIDKHTNGKATVSDIGEEFEVFFEESNRYYTVDKDGNLLGQIDAVGDKYPGDITKKEDGTVLDGSKEHPYEINCIEDLVAFSNMSNTETFENKTIILQKNLNFKSKSSYANWETKEFGDVNKDGVTDTLITELSTGNGFTPIIKFRGVFDGQENSLKNLYQTDYCSNINSLGLFGTISTNATIKNLYLSGNIEVSKSGSNQEVGGIVGQIMAQSSNILLENTHFSGNITDTVGTSFRCGGIIGRILGAPQNIVVNKCSNTAKIITSYNGAGIIGSIEAGSSGENINIINCFNVGDITMLESNASYASVGGIIGSVNSISGNVNVLNCYNTGDIENPNTEVYRFSGGIVGSSTNCGEYLTIANCYNIGKTTAKYLYGGKLGAGGILGGFWYNTYNSDIRNCFYYGENSDRSVGLLDEEYAQKLTYNQLISKENIEDEEGNSKVLIELLNGYKSNATTEFDTSMWCDWIQNEQGYPALDI